MDAKFRKLISRLSIKERMKPEKNLGSSGGCVSSGGVEAQSQLIITEEIHKDLALGTTKGESDSETNRSLIPHPTNYWPESNILTQLQFSCPTLLRKNKCVTASAMIEESFYEELKPRVREVGDSVVIPVSTDTVTESNVKEMEVEEVLEKSSPETNDENNNNDGTETVAQNPCPVPVGEDDESIYINLQELEQERRRLIAAQCVRAKYAENWIDGQVDEGSIVGNNRAKTKIYWEEQMRNEEKARNRGSKYGVNNAPSSDLIIQKMNAEIEELHRREKELKQKQKTEVEDEEDVFSSNTSSVDEFEHSDSPRLESGFYSNAGEDESIPSPELALETSTNDEMSRSQTESPLTVEVDVVRMTTPETQRSEGFVRAAVSPVQPLDEPESPPPVFTFQKETPIEREIRLARERDNEYMLRRLSSSTSNLNGSGSDFYSLPSTPVTTKPKPTPTPRAFSTSAAVIEEKAEEDAAPVNVTPAVVKGKPFNSRDIQYQMATERLKREIQEAKEREEELKSRELNNVPKTPVAATKTYVPDYVSVEPVKAVATRFQGVEKRKSYTFSANISVDDTPAAAVEKSTPSERKNSIKEASPVAMSNGVIDTPSTQTVAATEVSETKPEVSFTPIARPKFNSIERYLLKSSVKLRIGKNFQIPTAASVFEPETPVTPTDKTAEVAEEEQEPVTPRRKLIRAQDKIDQELREMREREKEFALRRAFKSTPDLSQESKQEENNNIANVNAEPITIRNKEGSPELKERRRSALINQWEEKIQTAN